MISKYNGLCSYCNLPTKANVDHYDLDSKTSYHQNCLPLEPGFISCPEITNPLAWCEKNGWKQFTWSDYEKQRTESRMAPVEG